MSGIDLLVQAFFKAESLPLIAKQRKEWPEMWKAIDQILIDEGYHVNGWG